MKTTIKKCLRTTVITKKPLLGHGPNKDKLATFIVPPQSQSDPTYIGNDNPIRIYQQNYFIEAAARGSFLILISMEISGDESKLENEK